MIEEPQLLESKKFLDRWGGHRFLIMIGASIAIALFLVSVALALYASSGTAQLDLTRPGYQSVRDQAPRSDTFSGFPATGTLDKAALEQYEKLYDERAKQAVGVESFGGNGMSDESLSVDAP